MDETVLLTLKAWCHWKKKEALDEDRELVEAVEQVLAERDRFKKRLQQITNYSECIGLDLCHTTGHCVHCMTGMRKSQ
jgi:hypothetical protein